MDGKDPPQVGIDAPLQGAQPALAIHFGALHLDGGDYWRDALLQPPGELFVARCDHSVGHLSPILLGHLGRALDLPQERPQPGCRHQVLCGGIRHCRSGRLFLRGTPREHDSQHGLFRIRAGADAGRRRICGVGFPAVSSALDSGGNFQRLRRGHPYRGALQVLHLSLRRAPRSDLPDRTGLHHARRARPRGRCGEISVQFPSGPEDQRKESVRRRRVPLLEKFSSQQGLEQDFRL
mmetsp:Transcript_3649/g.8828  ORF Transcript_3649/g.8828 Transcript_3649/m.8828 type:complete len:236 (+) Transcript_3649:789-1496(+)